MEVVVGWTLERVGGPPFVYTLPSCSDEVTVGCDSRDLKIDGPSVSSFHAMLIFENHSWHVVDLRSTHGVFVNKIRIEHFKPTPLSEGNLVQFGALGPNPDDNFVFKVYKKTKIATPPLATTSSEMVSDPSGSDAANTAGQLLQAQHQSLKGKSFKRKESSVKRKGSHSRSNFNLMSSSKKRKDKSAQSLRSNSDQKSLGRKKLAQKKRNGDTIMSNTSLASLNVDVLLYLIKFIDPVDRLNLVFSGILKGFENVSREIGFQKRNTCSKIELGLRHGSMCTLEIRSWIFLCASVKHDEFCFQMFVHLSNEGFLRNNGEVFLSCNSICLPDFDYFQCIYALNNLKKVGLGNCYQTFEDLSHLLRSCPRLTELHVYLRDKLTLHISEELKNELEPGFQRLVKFVLKSNQQWSVIQEILTWLKGCVHLETIYTGFEYQENNRVVGGLTLDPKFVQELKFLYLKEIPVEFAEWILPVCLNLHTLHVFRNCRQLTNLWLDIHLLKDLAELKLAENVTQFKFNWWHSTSLREFLDILKNWRNLCHLTLMSCSSWVFPQFETICDFIIEMKSLAYLKIVLLNYGNFLEDEFAIVTEKVDKFVLPHRPNFIFVICID